MTQGVTRLKELLFDTGADDGNLSEFERRIENARQRLSALENLSTEDKQARFEILRKLDLLFERAGTEEQLASSVAHVLDDALRKAEVHKHDEMSRALAPLVVQTIKSELKNSQDEMVQVLYPLTGRMVKAYVASAIKDLTEEINRKLEQNPVSLRIRSLVSGTPVADLAIARSQRLVVEEAYLIRRGSGALVARWPEGAEQSNRDIHMSGVLSAINDFASHAFGDDGGNLRTFELDEFHVYLRASPVYLLAAKCRGIAPSGAEKVFDDAFLSLLEDVEALPQTSSGVSAGTGSGGTQALKPLAEAVAEGTARIYDRNERAGLGFNPFRLLLFLVAVPLFSWLIWWGYTRFEEDRTLRVARSVVNDVAALRDYRPEFEVGYRGRSLAIQGIAPTAEVREVVLDNLKTALPGTVIEPRLAVLPTPQIPPAPRVVDPTPEIDALRQQLAMLEMTVLHRQRITTLSRSLDGTIARLRLLAPELTGLAALMGEGDQVATVNVAVSEVEEVLRATESSRRALPSVQDQAALDRLRSGLLSQSQRLSAISATISGLLDGDGVPQVGTAAPAADDAVAVAEILAAESQRASAMAVAVAKAIQQARLIRIPEPSPVAVPSPRQRLVEFVAAHAIFFANGTDFLDPGRAARTLDELAALMKGNPFILRVAGYTDESGGTARNSPLAGSRADAVVEELVRRGVPANRLVAIGRAERSSISPVTGASSPNRRVEFEVAFEGEGRR
jgi:outer membrane protein OmpA-like peptidoglycan-associated protein